ncbi:uncharacterized protein [Triticum aestivum]|uniref:uncharacterized protein n=1 Tax=Triticum aestivum TaxID=4565 RepID=UPI001D0136D5|nr:uncharacterized protein LOC123134689 [Triticum aestivum]
MQTWLHDQPPAALFIRQTPVRIVHANKTRSGRISFIHCKRRRRVPIDRLLRRMASLLLRSAAGRVLGRSIPLGVGSFRRSPGRFLSGGAQRIEYKHSCSNYTHSPEARLEIALEKFGENLQKAHEATLSLLEHEKRFERQEQRQKVLSYFLVPAGVAFLIFGPDKKKEKLEETIETST